LPYSVIQMATSCICMSRAKRNDKKQAITPLKFDRPARWLQENITR